MSDAHEEDEEDEEEDPFAGMGLENQYQRALRRQRQEQRARARGKRSLPPDVETPVPGVGTPVQARPPVATPEEEGHAAAGGAQQLEKETAAAPAALPPPPPERSLRRRPRLRARRAAGPEPAGSLLRGLAKSVGLAGRAARVVVSNNMVAGAKPVQAIYRAGSAAGKRAASAASKVGSKLGGAAKRPRPAPSGTAAGTRAIEGPKTSLVPSSAVRNTGSRSAAGGSRGGRGALSARRGGSRNVKPKTRGRDELPDISGAADSDPLQDKKKKESRKDKVLNATKVGLTAGAIGLTALEVPVVGDFLGLAAEQMETFVDVDNALPPPPTADDGGGGGNLPWTAEDFERAAAQLERGRGGAFSTREAYQVSEAPWSQLLAHGEDDDDDWILAPNSTPVRRGKQTVRYIGRPTLDLLTSCKRFLAPGNKLSLTLYPSSDAFRSVVPPLQRKKYVPVVKNLQLHFRRIKLASDFPLLRGLDVETYTFKRTVLRTFDVPANTLRWRHIINQADGKVPKKITLALVDSADFNKRSSTRPFYFTQQGLHKLDLLVDEKSVLDAPLRPSQRQRTASKSWHHFMQHNNKEYTNRDALIQHLDFDKTGYYVLPFDLTPDRRHDDKIYPGREGPVELDLEWSSPTTHNITVLALCSFDCALQVERGSRRVSSEYF